MTPFAHSGETTARSSSVRLPRIWKWPRGRAPEAPSAAPEAKEQVNFTDEESRIMKTKDGFQPCYNAQAGVDTDSRLIVGQRVSQSPNDKQELAEDLKAVKENVSPAIVLVDSGFVSESAVSTIEAENPGLDVLAAMKREPHGRTVKQLKKSEKSRTSARGCRFWRQDEVSNILHSPTIAL
jgi:hypothetical protein